jgi:hypothetical protein
MTQMKVKAPMEPYFTLISGCLIAVVVLITGETWGRYIYNLRKTTHRSR